MPGVLSRILGIATIEEVEEEQEQLRAAITESQKQLDALDVVLSILVIARDGKPPKKWSRKKGASQLDPTPVAVDHEEPEDTDEEDTDERPTLTANQQAVIEVLRRGESLTVGEISRVVKRTYLVVYNVAQKLIDLKLISKQGDKLALV